MLKTHWIQLEIKHRKQEEVEHVYAVVCITKALYFRRSLHLTRKSHIPNIGDQPVQLTGTKLCQDSELDRRIRGANLWESPSTARSSLLQGRGTKQRSRIPPNDLAMASNCYPPSGREDEPTAADVYFKCRGMLRSRWSRPADAAGRRGHRAQWQWLHGHKWHRPPGCSCCRNAAPALAVALLETAFSHFYPDIRVILASTFWQIPQCIFGSPLSYLKQSSVIPGRRRQNCLRITSRFFLMQCKWFIHYFCMNQTFIF